VGRLEDLTAWEARQRKQQGIEKRQETAGRKRLLREGHAVIDDHDKQFSIPLDGHGYRAKCQCGSDGEYCPDDDQIEPSFEDISSERTFRDIIVPDELRAGPDDDLEPDDEVGQVIGDFAVEDSIVEPPDD
jgi:hypothetical protein